MARAIFTDERSEEDKHPLEREPQKPEAEQPEAEAQGEEEKLGENPTEESAKQEDNSPEEDLPEKYRGKSPAELVRMHQEAEKLLGRQSSEVGDLRKVVDEFIQNQTELSKRQSQPQETEEEDDFDFFTDPKKAIEKAVQEHPDVKAAREFSRDYKKTTTMAALGQKHPDMAEILQSTEFQDWLKSSRFRQELFVRADQDYDYEAADELFTTWKAVRPKAEPEPKKASPKETQKENVKRASTGSARGSAESRGKKIYRRTDIIKLMNTDPDRYAQLQDEILTAYREGRVR
jgi:hypothetical protein